MCRVNLIICCIVGDGTITPNSELYRTVDWLVVSPSSSSRLPSLCLTYNSITNKPGMIGCKYIDQNYIQIDNVIFLTKYRGNASEKTTCTCRCQRKNIWLGLDSTTGWRMFSPVIDQDHKRNSFQINIIHGIERKADLIFYTIHFTVQYTTHLQIFYLSITQHKSPNRGFHTLF